MASASLVMDGLVIGTAGVGAVQADGTLQIDYNAGLGNAVPIAADTAKDLQIRITLKPNAGGASYVEFFTMLASVPAWLQ